MKNDDGEDISYKITFILTLIFLISLIIGVSSSFASSCLINEVMVNPIESDSSYEWIELYNPTNKTINLSGWKLSDNYATDEILPANKSLPPLFPSQTYVIITDQDTALTIPIDKNDSVIHYMVDDNSICNGLGNTDDFLKIIDENNTVIDTIEWGLNTSEIPGEAIDTPVEGNSLIRINDVQTNNSIIDFAETTIPTPGKPNIYSKTGLIHITKVQKYIPKINKFDTYSPPFAIHASLTNFTPNSSYQLKSFITGNLSTYPASQTWTGEKWQYSDRYTHTITTDESGCWQDWVFLRFSKNYNAYNENIQHNKSCLLNLKVKDNQTVKHIQKTIQLLDMDNSNSHGLAGGYYIDTSTQNQILFLTNETNDLLSCYVSEPNNIDDFSPTIDGYCKLTAPVSTNLTLSTINETGIFTPLKTNITILPGTCHFDTKTKESSFDRENRKEFSTTLTINNTGTLKDTYQLFISDQSSGFHAHLKTTKVTLSPNEEHEITVFIDPLSHRLFELQYGSITVSITSENDPILQKTHTFSCQLHEPDLTIPKIKTYNSEGEETDSCFQGRIFRIKAFLKNNGDETARDVTVSYFLDTVKPDNLLGIKTYETVEQYQKYPSLYLDTLHINPGKHNILVVTDYKNSVKELDEYNNKQSIQINIVNTTPSKESQKLLITELYYYAHPTIHNEFITLFNPTNTSISLDQWYITNTISQRCDEQKKIVFPPNTIILSNSSITIAQNSSAYYQEQMIYPDFEYETNANQSIPQLNTTGTIFLSNKGGSIALKNGYNHTIDLIIYGNTTEHHPFWNETPIPSVDQGEILKRKKENNTFLDTDSALDWIQLKEYHIGQSLFTPKQMKINASITPFISPDTSFSVISNLLENTDSEILLNAYEFTSSEITECLINALQRNVSIRLLVEGSPIGGISEKQRFLLNKLHNHGAKIQLLKGDTIDHIFKRYRFTHAKYAILDQETTILLSGNFAPTGIPKDNTFGNREWGIAIKNENLASWYSSVFNADWNPTQKDTQPFQPNPVFEDQDYFVFDEAYYGYYEPILNQSKTMKANITVQPVLSPDNSLQAIADLISQADTSIYIQQLYIYPNWTDKPNPLIPLLINKSNQGLDIKIILNYNPWYDSTNIHNDQTKTLLESHGIQVKYIYSNWSFFQNVHNKGIIIDNQSVLISSINWNENSFLNNREMGMIIDHPTIAEFYSTVFLSDWDLSEPIIQNETRNQNQSQQIIELNANTIYITALFTMTFIVVARDWRKRSWP